MPVVPDNLRFSEDHVWVQDGDGLWRLGITDYAQDSLGDIVAITLPGSGASVTEGEPFGTIESTKSISDLIAPISGSVERRNEQLDETPEVVNTDPYGEGWLLEIRISPDEVPYQPSLLIDADGYRQLTGE
jgi:glycine cleavage system H protein